MADPDMLYLSESAYIIKESMSNVRITLKEGSNCLMRGSKRGARQAALQLAIVARDRLNTLIAELGERL